MITSLASLFRELTKPVERECKAGAVIFRDGDPARYELGLIHETFYRRLAVLEKRGCSVGIGSRSSFCFPGQEVAECDSEAGSGLLQPNKSRRISMHGIVIGKSAWGNFGVVRTAVLVAAGLMAVTSLAFAVTPIREGLVEFAGAQKDIFDTGKAERVMSLQELAGTKNLFAIGPVEGLDGEITIFNSQPYISQVRGEDYEVHHSFDYGAIFLVWSSQAEWRDIAVPETVKGYLDLQDFVKAQARAAGIDTDKTFAFQLTGTPVEIKWHINVDRTGGQVISQELFKKSKAGYIMKNEPVDIIGFYSETHPGVFISKYAPAVKPESGRRNAIHIHAVSKAGKATGHIDDLTLGAGMTLRLPKS